MGGCISIFIKFIIYTYVIFNFKKMVLGEDDKNTTLVSLEKLSDMGEVKYSDTNHFAVYVLRKQLNNSYPLYLNHKDREEYIDIYFEQTENDWYANPGRNTKTVTRYEA